MKEINSLTISMLGIAAVGGLMAGTCLAVKKMLRNGEARLALFAGYAFMGVAFGIVGVSLGVVIPALDIESVRGALLVGVIFGGGGVLLMAAANIGSIITLRYFGLRVTIEPDDPINDRRSQFRRREDLRQDHERD